MGEKSDDEGGQGKVSMGSDELNRMKTTKCGGK